MKRMGCPVDRCSGKGLVETLALNLLFVEESAIAEMIEVCLALRGTRKYGL